MTAAKFEPLTKLIDYIKMLRHGKNPCPWTQQQTFESLAPQTLNETYELNEAIISGDPKAIQNELSDYLYHLIFYTQLGEEKGWFDINDLAQAVLKKHEERLPPHRENLTAEDINAYWQAQKEAKKEIKNTDLFANLNPNQPSLAYTQQCHNRAARVGFDWPDIKDVIKKCYEELAEIEEVLNDDNNSNKTEALQHEIGDLLLCAVNLARHANLDAEYTSRVANQRFMNRLRHMQKKAESEHRSLENYNLEELENLWQNVKKGNPDEYE